MKTRVPKLSAACPINDDQYSEHFFLIQESENSPAESTTASGASTSEGAVSSQPPRVPAAATTSRDRQGGDAAAVPTTTGRVRSNSESERQRNIAERLGITVSDKVLPLVTSFHLVFLFRFMDPNALYLDPPIRIQKFDPTGICIRAL